MTSIKIWIENANNNGKYLKFVLISNLKLENCLFWEQENKGK